MDYFRLNKVENTEYKYKIGYKIRIQGNSQSGKAS